MCSFSYLIENLWNRQDEHLYRIFIERDRRALEEREDLNEFLCFVPERNEFYNGKWYANGLSWKKMKHFIKEISEVLRTEKSELISPYPFFKYRDSYEETSIIYMVLIPYFQLTWDLLERLQEVAEKYNYYVF